MKSTRHAILIILATLVAACGRPEDAGSEGSGAKKPEGGASSSRQGDWRAGSASALDRGAIGATMQQVLSTPSLICLVYLCDTGY